MYPAPVEIEASCFATLPAELRKVDAVARFGSRRDNLLEGPSFLKDGTLLCVELLNSRIIEVDRSGQFSVAVSYDGQPNGLKIHRDGRVFVADRKALLIADLEKGVMTTFLDSAYGEPFRGLNDLVFDSHGNLFFTDQGQSALDQPDGRLYCLHADGRLQRLLDNVPSPNGLVLTPDEQTLYLAATRGNAVWRVPLNFHSSGEAGRVGIYIQLSGGTGPDGLAMSDEGHLVVAHIGMGSVWIFDPWGVPMARVKLPGRAVTNLAFDPSEPDMLYMTEADSGCIYRAKVPCSGMRMFSHA
jgi:gluconolactonase